MVRAIPKGRVTTYAAIGHALDVMPRHVDQTIRLANEGVTVEDDTVQDFEESFALPKAKLSSSHRPPTKRPPPTG